MPRPADILFYGGLIAMGLALVGASAWFLYTDVSEDTHEGPRFVVWLFAAGLVSWLAGAALDL